MRDDVRQQVELRHAVGTIAEQTRDHYALVTFPAGTVYDEGFTVEPIR